MSLLHRRLFKKSTIRSSENLPTPPNASNDIDYGYIESSIHSRFKGLRALKVSKSIRGAAFSIIIGPICRIKQLFTGKEAL
jgi:hypothetical protein